MYFVTVWSIWYTRNQLKFEDKEVDSDALGDKLSIGHWNGSK